MHQGCSRHMLHKVARRMSCHVRWTMPLPNYSPLCIVRGLDANVHHCQMLASLTTSLQHATPRGSTTRAHNRHLFFHYNTSGGLTQQSQLGVSAVLQSLQRLPHSLLHALLSMQLPCMPSVTLAGSLGFMVNSSVLNRCLMMGIWVQMLTHMHAVVSLGSVLILLLMANNNTCPGPYTQGNSGTTTYSHVDVPGMCSDFTPLAGTLITVRSTATAKNTPLSRALIKILLRIGCVEPNPGPVVLVGHNATIYHEQQKRQFCQVHALNAALGRPILTGETLLQYCKDKTRECQGNPHSMWPHIYHATNGNFSTMALNRWLEDNSRPPICVATLSAVYPHIPSSHIDLGSTRDTVLSTVLPLGIHCFMLHTDSLIGGHATCVRRVDGNWYHVDSNSLTGPVMLRT